MTQDKKTTSIKRYEHEISTWSDDVIRKELSKQTIEAFYEQDESDITATDKVLLLERERDRRKQIALRNNRINDILSL